MKDIQIVAGIGETGGPWLQLLQSKFYAIPYDTNPSKCEPCLTETIDMNHVTFLHVCIPYTGGFVDSVLAMCDVFDPEIIVIHSTVKPGTSSDIQNELDVPVVYSPIRGVHERMLIDLKRYTKWFASSNDMAAERYRIMLHQLGIPIQQMSSTKVLEMAKILVDTTYYGWLINYAQITKKIADDSGVDYDEMWRFSEDLHKYCGNRPKLYPGHIGGHCVIPNLDLIDNDDLENIRRINDTYNKSEDIGNV